MTAQLSPLRIGVCPPHRVRANRRVEVRVGSSLPSHLSAVLERVRDGVSEVVRAGTLADFGTPLTISSGAEGDVALRLRVRDDDIVHESDHKLVVEPESAPPRLAGAWVDIYHHDEAEAIPFNQDLATLTRDDWADLVDAMADVDQKVIVVSSVFHHFARRAQHDFDEHSYPGAALYPSELFPQRWPIGSRDPVEAILCAADRAQLSVFLGVGFYAFFDYSPAALRWAESVMRELWNRYGHHPSLYGWYFAHEQCGGLFTPGLGDPLEQQREMTTYVRRLTSLSRELAPEKYTMLATNTFGVPDGVEWYRRLLPALDILCPFGFHRMPTDDLTETEVMALLRDLCRESHTHLWADLESFRWPLENGAELRPRRIGEVLDDLHRLGAFEAVLHFQFPGLMTAPKMRVPLGGDDAIALYESYRDHLDTIGS